MSYFILDVESDGPVPPLYSMVCFGCVKFEPSGPMTQTFYGQTAPLFGASCKPEALAISGFTRKQHEEFDLPVKVFVDFNQWITRVNEPGTRPVVLSDNIAYDWQWINYYFHAFLGANPFGYSGRRIADLFCGIKRNMRASWKHLRRTSHTHNPVDDATGNAEALQYMVQNLNLKL